MDKILLPYDKAKLHIEEGDVLLFKGKGWFSRIFMRAASESTYTHVGVASLHNGIVEVVEFKEKHGGRTTNLENQFDEYDEIDIYRAVPFFSKYGFCEEHGVDLQRIGFDGKLVTDCMRKMTGLPYGWRRILWIALHKLPILRLFYNKEKIMNDELKDAIYPECSSSLSHCFNKHGYDIIPNKGDGWTEPADFARSGRLSYLFTMEKE